MDLYFYDAIGPQSLEKVLQVADTDEDVNLHINSPGGSVYDGLAIYNFLTSAPNRINVLIDGMAGSIASVVAMAGNTISIHESGMMMVHNASAMMGGGTKEHMEKQIEVLDKIDEIQLNIYSRRTKQPKEAIKSLMDKETYLTSKEAKKFGFVDKIIKPQKIAANINFDKMDNLLNDIKAKFKAMLPSTNAEGDAEAIAKLKEAADEIAASKLELKKEGIGDNIGDALTAEMVKFTDYEADRTKWNAFSDVVMQHIEKTQTVLDGLNKDIDGRIKTAMNELLAKVESKTEVPAPVGFTGVGEIELTPEEKKKALEDFAEEIEKNRTLKVKPTQ